MARRESVRPGEVVEFNDFRTACPRCGTFGRFLHVAASPVEYGGQAVIAVLRCQSCDEPIAVEGRWRTGGKSHEVTAIWPVAVPAEIEEAPPAIRQALVEVAICEASGAVGAGALACRRAVDLLARDKGQTEGGLRDRISRLDVSDDLKRIADGIRLIGDEAAHPAADDWARVTGDDLAAIHDLAIELVRQLYVMPERVRQLAERTEELGRGQPRPRS